MVLETPHRLLAALNDILLVLGNRKVAVCRELTKVHEEVFRGTVSQAIDHFIEPRGEFTLVIEGKINEDKPQLTEEIERELQYMRWARMTAKEAVAKMSEKTGISKRELYRAWLRISKS